MSCIRAGGPAVKDERTTLQLSMAEPQVIERDIDRTRDGAGRELPGGSNIHEHRAVVEHRVQFVSLH